MSLACHKEERQDTISSAFRAHGQNLGPTAEIKGDVIGFTLTPAARHYLRLLGSFVE